MFSILYVDDEPALLEIGKLFLEEKGVLSVDTVISAPKALLKIAERKYDAIISDYQMPEMDGIEFLKRVRASGNTVPFIIFTGRGREEIVIQAINEGADFYLQKGGEPVSQFAELEHKVHMAVMQRKAEASIRDHERREADIINFLPDATFAVDTNGVVIAWNRAMEMMTGVKSSEILGKDNYEYAIPFYHERRPILIDLVLKDDPVTAGKYPSITKDGTSLFSEITIPHFNNGSGAGLWFTASPLFDRQGTIVGAIESIRDITERKRAEAALHESEKRFRELSDLLPQVVYEVDESGNLTYANQVAFEWFGYPEDEFRQGLNILQMIVPHDQERAAAAFRALIEGKNRAGIADEYQALRKDGSSFPINVYASPVIANGRITGLRGIIVDITERRKAEVDLKNTVAFLNSLIDQSPTPMWISNEKGILIIINKACCDLLHINEADVIGKYSIFEDTMVIEQGFLSRIRNVFEKGNVARFQIKYDTKQLKNLQLDQFVSLILDETIFPVRDANGKITNAVIQYANITERKKAEGAALTESEIRFSSLIQNASDMIRILDREGKIVYESPSTEAIMGYPAGENIGKDALMLVHQDDLERVKSDLREVYGLANPGTPTEFRVRRADSTYIWVETIATNLLHVPAVNGVVITTRPIEQRKKMETALRQSEEKYRTVFETTGTATVLIENDATISLANSEFERLSGFRKDGIENRKKWTEFVVREDLDRMLAQHQLRRKNHQSAFKHYEFRFRSRSGEVRNIYLTIDVIPGTTKSVASLLDITERKQVEDSLVVANTEYTNLLNQIQDVYYRSDNEGRLVKASKSWATLLGYENIDECLGRNIADDFYFMPSDRNSFLEEVYRHGKVTDYEVRLKKKDGTPVLIATSSHLYYDSSGNIIGIEGTFRDITEKKRIEEALRNSEEKYRNIVEDQTEFISRFLPDGTHVFVNEAYCRYFGLVQEEILGHRFRPTIPAEDQERMRQFFASLTPDHPVDIIEHRIIMPDGTIRWQRWSDRAIFDTSGAIVEYQSVGSDITEQKEAEELLEFALWSADEGVIDVDLRTGILTVNSTASAILGYRTKEFPVTMDTFLALIHPDDRAEGDRKFSDLLAGTISSFDYEERMKTASGEWLWILARGKVVARDETGKSLRYIGTHRDIHKRKQAEEQLLESRERFQRIFEDSPLGIAIVSPEFTFRMVNRQFSNMLQYRQDELLAKSFTDITHPDHLKTDIAESKKLFTGERDVYKAEKRYLKKDGSILWASLTASPVKDESDKVLYTIALIEDITDRKQAEEKLVIAYQDYQTLLDQIQDVYYRSDTKGRLIRISRSMTDLLGYDDISELLGKNIAEEFYFNPDDRKKFLEEINQRGKVTNYEVQLKRKDGTPVVISASSHLFYNTDGTVAGIEGNFRDITEQKRAEQTIREANKKINLLTSITRHDVANQIATLRGYAKIAIMKKPDPIVIELLEKIDTAGSTIARQIEFTKAYQDLGMHAPTWVRISDIIAQQKPEGISLSCTCKAEVFADPMLEKVFSNLIDNAARHGKHVTLIIISCRIDPDGLKITVEDNGSGVPLDLKEKIFEKGYGKHTGFGLFLAREILAITGMTIHETGVPGKGARFEIDVPKGSYRITTLK